VRRSGLADRPRLLTLYSPMLADLAAFVQDHQAHGQLVGDATEPGWNGYMVTVACPCGVTFERWVNSA